MSRSTHPIYLKRIIFWFFLFLTGLVSLNIVIDPYALFGSARIEGVSKLKPAAASHVRMSKPYQVRRYRPRALIGGNSRPELGIDPEHKCWPPDARPVYNLGLPGAGVYRQYRTLQHAIHDSEVGLVLWGLDFVDFITSRADSGNSAPWPPGRFEFEQDLVVDVDGNRNDDYPWAFGKTHLQTMFSIDTLADSLATVAAQNNSYSSNRLANGFNPAQDYIAIIRSEGQRVLFRQKNREIDGIFNRSGLTVFPFSDASSVEFFSVLNLLGYAHDQGITVKLFINPYHVDYLEAIYTHSLWAAFEAWKQRLLEIAEAHGVELWDFSGLTGYNIENPPGAGDRKTSLNWFWEPAHYKKELGDLMLNSMLAPGCQEAELQGVGIRLKPGNIKEHLYRERQKLETFLADHGKQ